jgi:hypothetical protein
MQELTRLTEGRCALIAYARAGPRGNEHTANVLTPQGLVPRWYHERCDAYGLWRAGLYLEETQGLKHYLGHKNYDPVALQEDMLSLATVLGQGLSLLTHLNEGGRVEAWEPLTPERARQQFRHAHAVVKHMEWLVEQEQTKYLKTERTNAMTDNQANGKREPIHKLTGEGSLRAAIWLNKNQTTQEEYFTASFYRSYRDKQGQWQTSTSFRPHELPALMQLTERAYSLIQNELGARQGQGQRSAPGQEPSTDPEIEL